jgi:uncharacterized membrane protein YhhN
MERWVEYGLCVSAGHVIVLSFDCTVIWFWGMSCFLFWHVWHVIDFVHLQNNACICRPVKVFTVDEVGW